MPVDQRGLVHLSARAGEPDKIDNFAQLEDHLSSPLLRSTLTNTCFGTFPPSTNNVNPHTEKQLASYLANTKNLGRNVILVFLLFIPALPLFPLMNLRFHSKSKALQADPELRPLLDELSRLSKKELIELSKGLELKSRIAEFYLLRNAHRQAGIIICGIIVLLVVVFWASGISI